MDATQVLSTLSGKRWRVELFPFSSPYKEQGYGVFKVDDYELISARTADEAVKWFLDNWIVDPDELYPEPIEILLDDELFYVENPESDIQTVSYRKLVKEAIEDQLEFPCIVATYDW